MASLIHKKESKEENKTKSKVKTPPRSRVLQNPKILEVNLVRDQVKVSFDWLHNLWILALALLVALIFVWEIYAGLGWWQNQEEAKIKLTDEKIAAINSQVASLKQNNQDALDYKAKSAAFSALLGNHIYWTNFLNWLEKNTLSSVKYTGFSGDLSGQYTLSAVAPNYADVSWQVKSFLNDPLTKSVSVTSVSLAKSKDSSRPNQANFSIKLQINPSLFIK